MTSLLSGASGSHPLLDAEREERLRVALAHPPRHTSFMSVLTTPALATPFEVVVPGEMWTQVASGAAEAVCPCKATIELTIGIPAICSCGRPFLYTGREVRATWRRARDIADVRAMLRQIRFDS